MVMVVARTFHSMVGRFDNTLCTLMAIVGPLGLVIKVHTAHD